MITPELVQKLLTQGESENLEFKERIPEFGRPEEKDGEFAKDMIAFANS